jgi:hypothetical protein
MNVQARLHTPLSHFKGIGCSARRRISLSSRRTYRDLSFLRTLFHIPHSPLLLKRRKLSGQSHC